MENKKKRYEMFDDTSNDTAMEKPGLKSLGL